uniref:Uncharacterized protein n=2 Tax=Meloidogyne TaxID=189290 RepID=A0A6V7UK55_MELEN|nr:unnamed protein product [Meloidogyne enterolobii]
MLGKLFKQICVVKKFTVGSKRFMSWKKGVPSFTKKTKKPKEEPENVKIIYKLPEVIQKVEDNAALRIQKVEDSLRGEMAGFRGEMAGIRGEMAGIKLMLGLHLAISLFLVKLYFDLSQKQQPDSKPFGEVLFSRVKKNFNSYFVASGTDDN